MQGFRSETMPRLLLTTTFIIACFISFSQSADFISVRNKNGRIIKTFSSGSPIIFETKNGVSVTGIIKTIRNDSLFVNIHNSQMVSARFGFSMMDNLPGYVF